MGFVVVVVVVVVLMTYLQNHDIIIRLLQNKNIQRH